MILLSAARNVVEIGVAGGASSAYLLQGLHSVHRDCGSSDGPYSLYSYDVAEYCYFAPQYAVGAAVAEMVPALAHRQVLRLGDARSAGEELAGQRFQLAFIDGHHAHPWATADLLAILPVMAPGAWVVLHDIALGSLTPDRFEFGPQMLYECWPGEKRLEPAAGNCGAVRLPDDREALLSTLTSCLETSWETPLPDRMLELLPQSVASRHPMQVGWLREALRADSRGRGILIWGAGSLGRWTVEYARSLDVPVIGCIDSSATNGAQCLGLPVLQPDEWINGRSRPGEVSPLILVASSAWVEIRDWLEQAGLKETRHFVRVPAAI